MALSRAKLYWMLPAWGPPQPHVSQRNTYPSPFSPSSEEPNREIFSTPSYDIPVETQLLLLELHEDQEYALLLPLIDNATGFRCSLRPASPQSNGAMVVRMESGDEAIRTSTVTHAIYCISGPDPFALIDRGVVVAAQLSGTAQPREAKQVPAILDSLGWCSWDAMYTEVNPRGLCAGLEALAAGGCPAQWVVIDDGWQQTQLDGEFRKEGEGIARGFSASMQWMSLEQVRSRRQSADAVFQDLQISAPLRALERDKAEEKALAQLQPRSSIDAVVEGVRGAVRGDWSVLAGLPRRVAGAALVLLSAVKSKAEERAMRVLQKALEGSHSGSSAIEVFTAMATGPLRKPLLRFYAAASSHSRRLLSVKANGKFSHIDSGADAPLHSQSDNFGQVVAELKQRCGINYVLCWHAMCGYWSGLMPGAPEVEPFDPEVMFPRPSPGTLEVDASMRWVHPAVVGVGMPRRPRAFQAALHSYLRESGVDGVKVDVQATVSMFGWNAGGYAATARRYKESLEESVAQHLPGNLVLNSMCCDIESIYNMKHSALARVGEDFYPTIKASHTAHIANAAFTSLMIGPVAHVDFDMMHTSHEAAELHAAARAVSGGLVYISDRVGDHSFELLRRLVLPDGSVLRAQHPAKPTRDCLFKDISRDRKTVLKMWNTNAVTGIIGAFNVQGSSWSIKHRNYFTHDSNPPALKVIVKPGDVPGLQSKMGKYALYSDQLQEVRVLREGEGWDRELPGGGGFDLFVVSPCMELKFSDESGVERSVEVAPVGLVNMLNAGGAIMRAEPVDKSGVLAMDVRGCGEFLMYSSAEPKKVVVGGRSVEFRYDAERGTVAWEVPPPVQSGSGEVLVKF